MDIQYRTRKDNTAQLAKHKVPPYEIRTERTIGYVKLSQ